MANVAVVAVPNVNCQRMYLDTDAVLLSATNPAAGVTAAVIADEDTKSENEGLVLVAAC